MRETEGSVTVGEKNKKIDLDMVDCVCGKKRVSAESDAQNTPKATEYRLPLLV